MRYAVWLHNATRISHCCNMLVFDTYDFLYDSQRSASESVMWLRPECVCRMASKRRAWAVNNPCNFITDVIYTPNKGKILDIRGKRL
jgi:hypothetical protein